ncbi:MAG: SprB repeat-containing protein, partial [Bacteroidia bacterium]|nr:SprB repeat-containing protein [Bacteroidia bacterium]
MAAGWYYVTIGDANNCGPIEDSVEIGEPPLLSTSITGIDVLCNGDNTGTIDLTVTGGTGIPAFIWSNGETTEDLTGLSANWYYVTVTDINACQAFDSIELTEPSALVLTYVSNHVSTVGGNDGSIDVTVSGGVIPYSFLWASGETSEDIDSLYAGFYAITVTDSNNCVVSQLIQISNPECYLTVSISASTNVSCFGGNDGEATVLAENGTIPYLYLWSDGQTTETAVNLTAGTYSVTVTDDINCTAITNVTITEPALLVTTIAGANISCNGADDGSADLTVTGGTIPYAFAWSNTESSEDISSLSPATYYVTVTDFNGCIAIDSVEISEPDILVTNITGTEVTCNGSNDGSADLTVTGGTSSYNFAWSNGAITEDISGLIAGTYTVIVTDNNDCITNDTIIIGEPGALAITYLITESTCSASDGAIDVTVTGGTPQYIYLWDDAVTDEDRDTLCAGIYCGTVTDANGCTFDGCVTVNDPPAISIDSENSTDILCNGNNNGTITVTASGGT